MGHGQKNGDFFNAQHTLHKERNPYQLNAFFPFALRLIKINLPPRVRNLARNPWRRFCVRREGLKVRRLPARQAEAENERDCCCCGVGDANDVVFTVVAVVVAIDVRGNELLSVLRRERMAEEKGRLSWVVGWRLEPEIDQYACSILSFIPYFSISRIAHTDSSTAVPLPETHTT